MLQNSKVWPRGFPTRYFTAESVEKRLKMIKNKKSKIFLKNFRISSIFETSWLDVHLSTHLHKSESKKYIYRKYYANFVKGEWKSLSKKKKSKIEEE